MQTEPAIPEDRAPPRKWAKVFRQIVLILLFAVLIGWTLNRASALLERSALPAGFSRGLVQGAMMPMSMPNLLVGDNVTIYSLQNTGRTYKLGYTLGVNLCGLLFFGLFFGRLMRWRTKNVAARTTD